MQSSVNKDEGGKQVTSRINPVENMGKTLKLLFIPKGKVA